ncbi:hypothetical protein P9112_004254 [Eukaryota sp. TZLM1-RC]
MSVDSQSVKIAFIGIGHMGFAILEGLVKSQKVPANNILVFDMNETAVQKALAMGCVRGSMDRADSNCVLNVPYLLYALRPQQSAEFLKALPLTKEHCMISVVGGWNIQQHRQHATECRIVRTMPNTPLAAGHGCTAIASDSPCTPEDLVVAKLVFGCSGVVLELPETKFDAVTVVSGCGPAYAFYVLDNMIKKGVELGLDEETAKKAACQTLKGSAIMAAESDQSTEALWRAVCSPGGITEKAVKHFINQDMGKTIGDGMQAAYDTSVNFSKGKLN